MVLNETVTSFLSFHPRICFLTVLVFEFYAFQAEDTVLICILEQSVYLGSIVGRREFCLQPDELRKGFHSIIYLVN